MRQRLLTVLLIIVWHSGYAQYFQFSQYNFTPQRLNPAMTGATSYATATGLYRNQSTGDAMQLKSNILTLSYPLISPRNGVRWSGLGLSLMDDGTGQSGIYNHQEVGLSYAINIPVARYQTLSVGFKTLYANRRVNLDGLVTESQYIPDRGFDPNMEPGENLGALRNDFVTFSTGVYWQQQNRKGERISSLGLSVFDINQPEDNFVEGNNPYLSTFVLNAGIRVLQKERLALYPDILLTRNAALNLITLGMVTSYSIAEYRNEPDDKINLITRFTINRSAILGLQLHRKNFSVGVSYDFPASEARVANAGAFEVGLELRRLVDPKKKAAAKKAAQKKPVVARTPSPRTTTPAPVSKADSVKKTAPNESELSKRLRHKQDSVMAVARPGDLGHEPLLLEEATLRFGFDFNSADLDESSAQYLNDLAGALNDNPDLRINLTGHTDNVGSAKFNIRLSIERANSIRDQLVQRGVDPARITVDGKGLSQPLNDNSTPAKRAENRRVEMKIYYE